MNKFLLSAALTAALASPAAAQDATVYIGHGINGTDLQLSEALPVDITVNGAVLLAGVEFRTFTDALTLAPGSYSIQISPADPQNPGSQPPLIDVTVPLAADENATILAHLDDAGAATASKFVNRTSVVGPLAGVVQLQHTAWAPAVDIRGKRLFNGPLTVLEDVTNGAQAVLDVRAAVYALDLVAANTTTRVLGPAYIAVLPQSRTSFYVVGSLSNGTLEILALSY